MLNDCIFCGIVAGEIPATTVYEDANTVAFNDLHPQATTHVLVVTRQHFTDIVDLAGDSEAGAGLLAGIRGFVQKAGITDFRTVFNTGAGAGQTVFHVHAHVLAGELTGLLPG